MGATDRLLQATMRAYGPPHMASRRNRSARPLRFECTAPPRGRSPCLSCASFTAYMKLATWAKAVAGDRKIVVDRRRDVGGSHYQVQVRGAPGCILAFAIMAFWLVLLTTLVLIGVVALTLAIWIGAGVLIVLLIGGLVRTILRR